MAIILMVIAIVLIILEVATASTFFIWIAFGVFAAAITALFTSSYLILILVGAIVSTLSVLLLRTSYIKYFIPKERVETAFNELVGGHAIMQDKYHSNGVDTGIARVGGVDWSVQCERSAVDFDKEERVLIKKIEGARLIIEKEE